VLAACTPVLVACGAGFDAQTNQVYQPAVGVNDRSGDIFVINALVVTDGSGAGTVVAALINETDETDTLVSVVASSTSGAPLESSDLGGGIELPPDQSVQLADEGISVSGTAAAGEPGSQEEGGVTAGSFVVLQFQFEQAAVVTVEAPVVIDGTEHQDVYEDIPVSPPPSGE
jgi:hypothetical protein